MRTTEIAWCPSRSAARAAAGLSEHVQADHVVVIGDTPRDVACAHAHGARVIAVATGQDTSDALAQAGADVVFDDFNETEAVLRALAESVRVCSP